MDVLLSRLYISSRGKEKGDMSEDNHISCLFLRHGALAVSRDRVLCEIITVFSAKYLTGYSGGYLILLGPICDRILTYSSCVLQSNPLEFKFLVAEHDSEAIKRRLKREDTASVLLLDRTPTRRNVRRFTWHFLFRTRCTLAS